MTRRENLDRLQALVDQPDWKRIFETVKLVENLGLKKVALLTVCEAQYQAVLTLIESELYRLDAGLNNTGRPWTLEDGGHIWILTSEPAEKADVIIDLKDPATWKDLQQLHPAKDTERIEELKKQGYLYSAKWRDLVELTKYRTLDEDKTPENGVTHKTWTPTEPGLHIVKFEEKAESLDNDEEVA